MQHTVHHEELPNGISLVVIPMPGTAAVTTIVFMEVGSRYESETQQGLAHFTEHMVFKGGKRYTSTRAITQALDSVGGEFNAFTSQEFTGFYTKTAVEHFELGVDILSDMLLNATFPADELEKEKGVIVEEINMYEDMPIRKVDHLFMRLLFGDTPLGRPIAGTKETVTAFIQADFLKYREVFYKGGNCTIAIAGAVSLEEARAKVLAHFAELPAGDHTPAVPAVYQEERIHLEEKKSEQTHLMLAVRAFPNLHPSRYILRVLTTILGGNMSSRLFVSVREQQGLCYYVRASTDTYQDIGALAVSAGVDNKRLHLAITAIIAEFDRMRTETVSEEELERAKQYLIGKSHLNMEDSEEVAEYYGVQEMMEKSQDTLEQAIEQIRTVTSAQVRAVAEEIFTTDSALRLALIGPHEDRAALEKVLQFPS